MLMLHLRISHLTVFPTTAIHRCVFRTLPNAYDEDFCKNSVWLKQLIIFANKTLSKMFDKVLPKYVSDLEFVRWNFSSNEGNEDRFRFLIIYS